MRASKHAQFVRSSGVSVLLGGAMSVMVAWFGLMIVGAVADEDAESASAEGGDKMAAEENASEDVATD